MFAKMQSSDDIMTFFRRREVLILISFHASGYLTCHLLYCHNLMTAIIRRFIVFILKLANTHLQTKMARNSFIDNTYNLALRSSKGHGFVHYYFPIPFVLCFLLSSFHSQVYQYTHFSDVLLAFPFSPFPPSPFCAAKVAY